MNLARQLELLHSSARATFARASLPQLFKRAMASQPRALKFPCDISALTTPSALVDMGKVRSRLSRASCKSFRLWSARCGAQSTFDSGRRQVRKNCEKMLAKAEAAGVGMRVHVKTHKIPQIAEMQVENPSDRVLCQAPQGHCGQAAAHAALFPGRFLAPPVPSPESLCFLASLPPPPCPRVSWIRE